jgi:CDP-glucose 4,6-dehydratase
MNNRNKGAQPHFFQKHVLITGATGFVGTWLVRELVRQGALISILSKKDVNPSELVSFENVEKITIFRGDISRRSSIDRIFAAGPIDCIFHLAAVNLNFGNDYSPLDTLETNIRGTYNLLETSRTFGYTVTPIVTISSRELEDAKPHPYRISKKCAELICLSYRETYNLNVGIFYSPNIYGGGHLDWSRIVPSTIRSLIRGEQPTIRSTGTLRRNYLYIKDVVAALLFIAEYISKQKDKSIFNVEDRNFYSTIEVVEKIQKIYGNTTSSINILSKQTNESEAISTTRPNEIDSFGWNQQYDLDRGLKDTVEWYRTYFEKNKS